MYGHYPSDVSSAHQLKYRLYDSNKSPWLIDFSLGLLMLHLVCSCYTWFAHVTLGLLMLHLVCSCYTWFAHVTLGLLMLHLVCSCYTWFAHVTLGLLMLHLLDLRIHKCGMFMSRRIYFTRSKIKRA